MVEWNYGDAYKRYHLETGKEIRFKDGSRLMVNDILDGIPHFMLDTDVIFTDSPWNIGNLKSFYTKADMEYPAILNFEEFYHALFNAIGDIRPRVCYLEIGKEYLADYIVNMRRIYKSVTFFNSTYYHKHQNLCYIVRGATRRRKLQYDGMDEEDIISAVAKDEEYGTIGDLCMGRGLVACAAVRNGRRFVGTELNHKRLAVCVERVHNLGLELEQDG